MINDYKFPVNTLRAMFGVHIGLFLAGELVLVVKGMPQQVLVTFDEELELHQQGLLLLLLLLVQRVHALKHMRYSVFTL